LGVPARVDLDRLLRRVRRRLRLWAGIEGGVVGACLALAFFGARVLAARWGMAPGAASVAIGLGCVAAGLIAGAARRISLVRCARAVDRAVGGDDDRNGDRTLAALALMAQFPSGPELVEAAIGDAARTVRDRGLIARAAPFRRPRGVLVAAALAGISVLATLLPARRVPAALAIPQPERPRVPLLNEAALRAERAMAAEAAAQAAAQRDPELARLAAELARLVESLGAGTVDQAEGMAALARLEKQAARAADEGRTAERAFESAAAAFEHQTETRALAEAMRSSELDAGKQQAEAMADRSKQASKGERDRVASALSRAAQASARAAEASDGEQSGRRLSSPGGSDAQARQGGERERQLKHLDRDLSDGAEQCRQDPEACRQALRQLGADLPEATRQARQSGARDRLGRSMQQLRERLKRQNGNDGAQATAEEDFERAAGGMRPMPAGDPSAAPEGKEGAEGAPVGTPSTSSAEAEAAGTGSRARASTDTGEGMGDEAGGDPLGDRGRANGPHGEQREARLRDGAGPSRAEVIEAGAHRGFARTEYQRVFRDYSAVVEESLDTTAVPPARRYLVRRYFELIRPRESGGLHGR
jgi:hypothetical protein